MSDSNVSSIPDRDHLRAELREEMRSAIHLGCYEPHAVLDHLRQRHGEDWLESRGASLVDPYAAMRDEAAKQLAYVRRRVDRETASQKRTRKEREAREIAKLGLPPTASALQVFSARLDASIKTFKREAVAEFLTDLLVPQALPDGTWKRRHDLTHEDCLAIAESYEKSATTEVGMMVAFSQFADVIREQGVDVLGEVDFVSAGLTEVVAA